jgi:hypothetical protein
MESDGTITLGELKLRVKADLEHHLRDKFAGIEVELDPETIEFFPGKELPHLFVSSLNLAN